jgi:hypothetical protein
MVFGGEASWHWKMMLPAADRTYDRFWRQAARWLTADAPDPVSIDAIPGEEAGAAVPIAASVREADYKPAPEAAVSIRLTRPDGRQESIAGTLADAARGRFTAQAPAGDAGISRVHIEALKGATALGSADSAFLSGAFDRELADPRLDARTLKALAEASGGTYLTPERAADAARVLQGHVSTTDPGEWRDWWQSPWMIALVLACLSAEWILRRQWGLK